MAPSAITPACTNSASSGGPYPSPPLRRTDATGPVTVRADSGFWSWELVDQLNVHGIACRSRSPTTPLSKQQSKRSQTTHGSTSTTPSAVRPRSPRPPSPSAEAARNAASNRLAWSCAGPGSPTPRNNDSGPSGDTTRSSPNTALDTVAADAFHRQHAVVELAIRDLKEGAGADHIPSGHYHANAAWLACAVLAHNLGCWSTQLAGQPPVTNRTRRTRLIAVPAASSTVPAGPCCASRPAGPGPEPSTQCSTPYGALPGPSG